MPQSKIFILYTGGTIGMVPDDVKNPKSPLVPGDMEDLSQHMPSLKEGGHFRSNGTEFTYQRMLPLRDSSEILPEHWQQMAGIILDNYEEHDGFVIMHGTDTLAYTSSALSFLLNGIDKPVVLTGSQLPISHPRSDGYNNLIHAVMVADYKSEACEVPKISGVSVSFDDKVFRGNACYKADTSDFGGIYARKDAVLVQFEEEIVLGNIPSKLGASNLGENMDLETNVLVAQLFPGFNAEFLLNSIENTAIKGIIFQSFGTGNYWMDPNLVRCIRKCHEKKIILLNTSQCIEGHVKYGKYKSGAVFYEHDVMSGKDITMEAAITKMMWCLGNFNYEEAKEKLRTSLNGEMSY